MVSWCVYTTGVTTMPKHYSGSKMPNESGGKKSSHKGMGTNKGASTGLRHESQVRADVMKSPSNKNPFPHGMA